MTEKVLKKLEAVSLSEATEVKIEARFKIYMKFHVKYSFAVSRHDCVGHPKQHTPFPLNNWSKLIEFDKQILWMLVPSSCSS